MSYKLFPKILYIFVKYEMRFYPKYLSVELPSKTDASFLEYERCISEKNCLRHLYFIFKSGQILFYNVLL